MQLSEKNLHFCKDNAEAEVEGFLRRKFPAAIRDIEAVLREDLDLKNHLSGLQRRLLKVHWLAAEHACWVH